MPLPSVLNKFEASAKLELEVISGECPVKSKGLLLSPPDAMSPKKTRTVAGKKAPPSPRVATNSLCVCLVVFSTAHPLHTGVAVLLGQVGGNPET